MRVRPRHVCTMLAALAVGCASDSYIGTSSELPGIRTELRGSQMSSSDSDRPGSALQSLGKSVAINAGPDADLGFEQGIVGDLDGDGFDDFVVMDEGNTAEHSTATWHVRGAAYLFYGRAEIPAWLNATDADAVLHNAGGWLTRAGDLDGDGLPDLAYASLDGVYVVFGNRTRLQGEMLSAEAGILLTDSAFADPIVRDDFVDTPGVWVKAAGDVNEDGRADLGIDINAGPNQNTYLILGRRERWPATGTSIVAEAAAVFMHPAGVDATFLPAGDVDGDGYHDLMISSRRYADETGETLEQEVLETRLYYGSSEGPAGRLRPTDAEAVFEATFVIDLGAIGDFDGDGFDDFVLYDSELNIQLFYGRPERFSGSLSAGGDLVLTCKAGGPLGSLVENDIAVGDFDGDGRNDLVISDGQSRLDGIDNVLYMVRGATRRHAGIHVLQSSEAVTYGPTPSERESEVEPPCHDDPNSTSIWGEMISRSGDVNGDGHADILIGNPIHGGIPVYLVLGAAPVPRT